LSHGKLICNIASSIRPIGVSGCDLVELTTRVVVEGLHQFVACVHHEGTVAGDWLPDWLAVGKQKLCARITSRQVHSRA